MSLKTTENSRSFQNSHFNPQSFIAASKSRYFTYKILNIIIPNVDFMIRLIIHQTNKTLIIISRETKWL